jgi:hypothetical protein
VWGDLGIINKEAVVFKYADYSFFVVLTEDLNYTMLLNGFANGTAGNSLGDHNFMQFSTRDHDNDLLSFKNCARDLKGGWWFTGCYTAFLNGLYSPLQDPSNPIQISWRQFKVICADLTCVNRQGIWDMHSY